MDTVMCYCYLHKTLVLVQLKCSQSYHSAGFCDCIVCIEIGGADDDERKELINSLSGSHDVHLNGNPQGTA